MLCKSLQTLKEGSDTHLNKHTARGSWPLSESKLHINFLELRMVFLALKEFQDHCSDKIVLVPTDNTTVLHKQGRRHEVRLTLCSIMENPDLVCQETEDRDLSVIIQQVASVSNRPFCHEVQQQVASVCVTSTGSPGLGSDAFSLPC